MKKQEKLKKENEDDEYDRTKPSKLDEPLDEMKEEEEEEEDT